MKDKIKLISMAVTTISFVTTKILLGSGGNPIQNILMSALVGGLIGGIFAIIQILFEKKQRGGVSLGKWLLSPVVLLVMISVGSLLLLSKHVFRKNKLTFSFPHCVLTHAFLSEASITNSGFWKKEVPGFKVNCESTGKIGCQYGLKDQEICYGNEGFSEFRCVKHPDDASYSSDFTAMWPIGDEMPKLQVIPISIKDVSALCRKLDNSCDAAFNVYAENTGLDTENIKCSGSYKED